MKLTRCNDDEQEESNDVDTRACEHVEKDGVSIKVGQHVEMNGVSINSLLQCLQFRIKLLFKSCIL